MSGNCQNMVVVDNRQSDGSPIIYQCGRDRGGERVLCAEHEAYYKNRFPQGWLYYPGDLCPHGVYVGGCGADYMCGHCENGEN